MMPKQLLTIKTLFQFLLVAVFAWGATTAVVEAKSGKSAKSEKSEKSGKSGKSGKNSPTQLMITEVFVNSPDSECASGESLSIRGTNFDNGGAPFVLLGMTAELDVCGTPTEFLITAQCPEAGCPGGDFRLEVFTGNGEVNHDSYDLTIGGGGGTVGPQGPKGDEGPSGSAGLSVYAVESRFFVEDSFNESVSCNTSDSVGVALGGGYQCLLDLDELEVGVVEGEVCPSIDIFSTIRTGDDRWEVTGLVSGAGRPIIVQVVCLAGPSVN